MLVSEEWGVSGSKPSHMHATLAETVLAEMDRRGGVRVPEMHREMQSWNVKALSGGNALFGPNSYRSLINLSSDTPKSKKLKRYVATLMSWVKKSKSEYPNVSFSLQSVRKRDRGRSKDLSKPEIPCRSCSTLPMVCDQYSIFLEKL